MEYTDTLIEISNDLDSIFGKKSFDRKLVGFILPKYLIANAKKRIWEEKNSNLLRGTIKDIPRELLIEKTKHNTIVNTLYNYCIKRYFNLTDKRLKRWEDAIYIDMKLK